ncbi:hypothetical protein [Aureliella helgolandensis]|uniref:hypothetical protein n=1 Tax=Aureliella helgolandensis TaxID=2527968 RepID=UPI0018D05711|nr:hypothetical protein [Aureliella helgolandensis]
MIQENKKTRKSWKMLAVVQLILPEKWRGFEGSRGGTPAAVRQGLPKMMVAAL